MSRNNLSLRNRENRWIAILVAFILVSIFVLGNILSDPKTYKTTIEKLDEKKRTVTAVSAISAAAATALALVPDDSTTPVAEQIADLSGYAFLISLVILLEKYVAVMSGALAFRLLIPLGCAALIAYIKLKKQSLKRLAIVLIAVSLCIVLIVPFSLVVEKYIDRTFDTSKPIRAAMNEEIADEEIAEGETKEGKSIFAAAGEFFSNIFNKAKKVGQDAVNLLNNLIDAFVALILKDCVIPIAVFLLLYRIIKFLLATIIPADAVKVIRERPVPRRIRSANEGTEE